GPLTWEPRLSSPRFLPGIDKAIRLQGRAGEEAAVVIQDVLEVNVALWILFWRIRVLAHSVEGQRIHEVAIGGVEIHIFLVTIDKEEVVALPAGWQQRQPRRIKLELQFISAAEDHQTVVDVDQQVADVSQPRVGADRTRVGPS